MDDQNEDALRIPVDRLIAAYQVEIASLTARMLQAEVRADHLEALLAEHSEHA